MNILMVSILIIAIIYFTFLIIELQGKVSKLESSYQRKIAKRIMKEDKSILRKLRNNIGINS